MAKKDVKLDVGVDEGTVESQKNLANQPHKKEKKSAKSNSAKNSKNPGNNGQPNVFQRMAKGFSGMISELKKVDWPSMKRTKNNPGVLANTGTVLFVVLFFLVIITAFDSGLLALLRLLVGLE